MTLSRYEKQIKNDRLKTTNILHQSINKGNIDVLFHIINSNDIFPIMFHLLMINLIKQYSQIIDSDLNKIFMIFFFLLINNYSMFLLFDSINNKIQ